MRLERWYWLAGFCMLSLCIHLAIGFSSRTFALPTPPNSIHEIEIALQPEAPPKPEPRPIPKAVKPPVIAKKPIIHAPVKVKSNRVAATKNLAPAPVQPTIKPDPKPVAPTKIATPIPNPSAGLEKLKDERPALFGAPEKTRTNGSPSRIKIARAEPEGGAAAVPAPSSGPGNPTSAPEAPKDDIQYAGGGAGGRKLPRALASLGGGGGRSMLSVENPLAKSYEPQDKPGLGPGSGGGAGIGAGGGVGASRGKGIGTNAAGKIPLASLRQKDGPGIGDGAGSGIGSKPSGNDRGVGAETQ
ncbi:MAG: hypothetical protein ABJA67_05825, partial [Chthonomonadales bacterium]